MRRPLTADWFGRSHKQPPARPIARKRVARRFLADVEHVAETIADVVDELHERGLVELAERLERALLRLAGDRG